ncbi:segregation/condensation protein A [Clostridium sp. P21]|uniref:Segregation and condensation protein A n=1 Tax=Clostridium muellerianum TaxID=2716538 RepID=A0A7Y0EDY0_9CLOT|nr:segregation/condensation protein A [Clostridium muellerianum]NMM61347.1 segregation/condensation protein A [Clostridium muellerianum]
MSLNIKIENFEGPFDLLLHLIKKNKMDIYDIKIHDITNQYLEYIKAMEEMDLEITSEFIVISATLIEIKSKMLLPKTKVDENAADSDEKDPRKELINKLIEYKKFKESAKFFKQREQGVGRMFSKKPEIIEEKNKSFEPQSFLKGITMLHLFDIYNKLMNIYKNKINTGNAINKEIPLDRFKIEDKIDYLKGIIVDNKKIVFSNIVKHSHFKMEVVVTFLALLELMKLRVVKVIQENNFKEIYIERINDNEGC